MESMAYKDWLRFEAFKNQDWMSPAGLKRIEGILFPDRSPSLWKSFDNLRIQAIASDHAQGVTWPRPESSAPGQGHSDTGANMAIAQILWDAKRDQLRIARAMDRHRVHGQGRNPLSVPSDLGQPNENVRRHTRSPSPIELRSRPLPSDYPTPALMLRVQARSSAGVLPSPAPLPPVPKGKLKRQADVAEVEGQPMLKQRRVEIRCPHSSEWEFFAPTLTYRIRRVEVTAGSDVIAPTLHDVRAPRVEVYTGFDVLAPTRHEGSYPNFDDDDFDYDVAETSEVQEEMAAEAGEAAAIDFAIDFRAAILLQQMAEEEESFTYSAEAHSRRSVVRPWSPWTS